MFIPVNGWDADGASDWELITNEIFNSSKVKGKAFISTNGLEAYGRKNKTKLSSDSGIYEPEYSKDLVTNIPPVKNELVGKRSWANTTAVESLK